SRHEVGEGRIGSAIDCECTTDSDGVCASPAPLTGVTRVTRHAPLCPPRKIVNMGTWKRGTGIDSRRSTPHTPSCPGIHVIPGREANPESRDSGFTLARAPE